MAVRTSPNPWFTGQPVMADVPQMTGQAPNIIDMFLNQAAGQTYDPQGEEIARALAERERLMAERGQSAPTYLPQGPTQGSLASVPHTGGYAGPTRPSDIPFDMAQMPIMRPAAEQAQRAQPFGQSGMTAGRVMDMLAPLRGQPKEVAAGLLEKAMPGAITDLTRQQVADKRAQVEEAKRQRTLEQRLNNAGSYYNKKTSNTLAEDFPDRVPTNEEIEANYVPLKTQQQRDAVTGLKTFDQLMIEFENIAKDLPLAPGPGLGGRGEQAGRMLWRRMIGDENVRNLEGMQKQLLLNLNRAWGGTSKNIDAQREIEAMTKAIPGMFDNRKVYETMIARMKRARDTAAQTVPIPGLHNKYVGGEQKQRQTGTSKSGKPIYLGEDGKWHYGE